MKGKFLKALGAAFILFLFVVGVLFAARMVFWSKDDPGIRLLLDQKNKEIEDKERQIEALESQIARLRMELEESSKRIAELEAGLQESARELSSAHEELKSARREAERSAAKPAQPPVEKTPPKAPEPAPSPVRRRPAEPGIYETVRATVVFAEPSAASKKVASISRGVRVTVVGSVGEWLEVRSKHGNPPGFIQRDDAMFVEK